VEKEGEEDEYKEGDKKEENKDVTTHFHLHQ
jgi:hypothetical protein